KPVSDRTFLLARLLHILVHVCKLILPMGIPGVVYVYYHAGLGGALLLVLLIVLLTLFAIFFINAVYILILRLTTPQRFQNIISYFQIVFAVVVYGGYQLFPRMIGRYHLDELDLSRRKAMVLYPIFWMANSWKVLYQG